MSSILIRHAETSIYMARRTYVYIVFYCINPSIDLVKSSTL